MRPAPQAGCFVSRLKLSKDSAQITLRHWAFGTVAVAPSSGATNLRNSHTSLLAPHGWTQVRLDILLEAFSEKAFSEKACDLAAFAEHGFHWPASKLQALRWLPSRRLNF